MSIRRSSSRVALGVVAGVLLAMPALADSPAFSFSGYGTVGVVHSDNDRGDYLIDPSKPTGPGHTDTWTREVDSRLGGQVSAQFSPRFSGVVQVIAQQRYDGSWRPTVEWANVKFEIVEDLSIRAGRVVLPVFNVTDSRRIGYAYPWIRPPVEVYSLVPVTHSDGIDVSWRVPLGPATGNVQLNLGKTDSNFPQGRAEGRRLALLAATVEHGATTLRGSYGRTDLTVAAFDPLLEAFRQFGPAGVALADRYSVSDRRVEFVGVGASYDPERWFVNAEWAKFDTHSFLGARSSWYVSAGARLRRFTPYATYARTRPESDTSDPGLSLAGLPPPLAGAAAGLNAALNGQLGAVPAQETVSIGVRWDFWRNAALKLQLDHVKLGAGSRGVFGNIQPGFEPGGRTRLFSAAIDFVF